MNRRNFLSSAGVLLAGHSFNGSALKSLATSAAPTKADYALRIEPCTLDIGPGVSIKTIGYNGQVPGPLLRLREGVPVSIDVTNATAQEDIVHWHGLAIDSLNDGAMEEGSPMIRGWSNASVLVHPEAFGDPLVSHPCNFERQSVAWDLYGAVWFFAYRGQGPAGALRSGDQPRDPSLGAIVCADGRDDA